MHRLTLLLLALATLASTLGLAPPARADVRVCLEDNRGIACAVDPRRVTTAVLPTLGVGVVYVPGLEPLLAPGESCVDVIEVEPEVLWRFDPAARTPYGLPPRTLERLRRLPQPKLVHSVGFGLGGSRRPRPAFPRALAETVRSLGAPWASGHLSFTEAGTDDGAFHTGFLLPLLHTREGARCARETLRKVDVPEVWEGPSPSSSPRVPPRVRSPRIWPPTRASSFCAASSGAFAREPWSRSSTS